MAAETPAVPPPPAGDAAAEGPATTDEDILRLRSRLDREFALVAQKLVDAEETLVDIEISLRSYESGSRPRLPALSGSAGSDKITSRLRAVGDGFNKIKEWVVKRKEDEGSEASAPPAGAPDAKAKGPRELDARIDEALKSIGAEIRDREREATELDRKLHEAQKELIKMRAQEQHAREMQIRIGQTKQLSEDLERRMAMLDEMVRSFETSAKGEPGARPKPKEAAPAVPKIDDRLQSAIDEALKNVAAQEKKVSELEKEVLRANASLVDERARQQRIRGMQVRLRQARHFSTDLQRSLAGLAASLEDLSQRAAALLRPEGRLAKEATRVMAKPASEPAGSKPAGP